MKLTIQLLTWNGEVFMADCLSSLASQTYQDWQLYITDNNSTDETKNIIRRWLINHRARLDERTNNMGFARGHNQMLKLHNTPYVCILNQDVFLENNYLQELVNYLEAHERAASVTGCLLRWELNGGRLAKTDVIDSAGLKIFRSHRLVERWRNEKFGRADAVEEIFGVPATAALYRRAALDQVSLRIEDGLEWFDGDFGSYKEDVDLAYRLRLMGWPSYYVPTARAYHHRGLRGAADTGTGFFTFATWRERQNKSVLANRQSYRNHLFFLFKSFAFSIFSSTWWATVLYEFAKALALAISEPKTFLYAWAELWRRHRLLKMKRRQIFNKINDSENIKRFFC